MAKKKGAPGTLKPTKLPNAPLAEVVFEIKWALVGAEQLGPFRRDPGFFGFLNASVENSKSLGFREWKPIAEGQMTPPYTIELRFYKSADEKFPVLQIGQGVLAINESTQYTWTAFKELCVRATEFLTVCYPKMDAFPLKPIQLELKYIDALKRQAEGEDLFRFLNEETHFKFGLPSFFNSADFGQIGNAQVSFSFPVKKSKGTTFSVSLTKGKVSDSDALLMHSAYTTNVVTDMFGKNSSQAKTAISRWLDEAHNVTSPFFREVVKDSLMNYFKEPINA